MNDWPKIDKYRRTYTYGHTGFLHVNKDKHCVLKGRASLRTINGIFINTDKTGMVCIQFRRFI